jgi:hypothetical protein
MTVLLSLIFTFVMPALAAVDDEPPIRAGAMISVQAWDAKSKTYDIELTEYPAQGPNYATLKDLAAAVKTVDSARAKRNPASLVGMAYKLDADLKLQSVMKIDAIRAGKKK